MSTEVDAWYYFKRHFHYPSSGEHIDVNAAIDTPMNTKTIDWENQLLKKDLVILVATEYWLPELGFGFIEEASAAIERINGEKKCNLQRKKQAEQTDA